MTGVPQVLKMLMSAAGDTKRLQELEVKLHNGCSVPLGFGALSMPGTLSH
jgi:hypothetical protein